VSPTFSVCPIHGYLDGEHFECPNCKAEREEMLAERLASLEKEKNTVAGGTH